MLQRERVLRRHPRLRFIAAHWAGAAGDRPYLAELLEKYPNMYAEGGANQPKAEFAELDSVEAAFFVRYQDQVMFGTDYMEKTFRWLKSYRQRLDMFLPFTEHWPLPDSVMRKYYHGNARRLLGRAAANLTPIAHPGFTSTHVAGDTVTLDGSASYAGRGTRLRYRWAQWGPRVRLVGDTARRTLRRERRRRLRVRAYGEHGLGIEPGAGFGQRRAAEWPVVEDSGASPSRPSTL